MAILGCAPYKEKSNVATSSAISAFIAPQKNTPCNASGKKSLNKGMAAGCDVDDGYGTFAVAQHSTRFFRLD
jgi:hypothetical protein